MALGVEWGVDGGEGANSSELVVGGKGVNRRVKNTKWCVSY